MKKINIILVTALFILLNESCKKDEEPNVQTPIVTKSFVAYVDGAQFMPVINSVYIDTVSDGIYLVQYLIAPVGNKNITIQFTGQNTGNYQLTGGSSGLEVGTYNIGLDSNWICTASAGGGNIVITKYDRVNNKISGTFSFKAKIFGTNNIKNITNGEFNDVEIR
jgi:hypothetical protein